MIFKGGIRFRLFLLGFIPAGIAVLCLESYFIHHQISELEQNQRLKASLIAHQIASVASLNALSPVHIQSFLRSTTAEPEISRVEITDESGEPILFANQSDPVSPDFNKIEYQFRFESLSSDLQRFPENADPEAGDSSAGYVNLVLATRPEQHTFFFHSFLIALASLIPILAFAEVMGRKISKPIVDLTLSVLSVTRGNLGTRAPCNGSREIRALQNGFNTMAAAMQKNQAQLENKVYIATVRLQQTLRSLEEKNLNLEDARQQAVTQNNAKSRFLAHVSHEIRTPMNGIMGFVELLSKSDMSAEQKDQLQLIETSAGNLLDIINEVLDLSKLESEDFSLNYRSFNLRPYLEDTVSLLSPQARNTDIILCIDQDFPAEIVGDPIRIQQVITNLLGNALKFTEHGRIVIRARRRKEKNKRYTLLSVSDNGCGIAKKDQKILFSPFQRLSEFDVSHDQGTGLGLAISKNIVEHMNGRIGVVSSRGTGSTFWVMLPLENSAVAAGKSINVSVNLLDSDSLNRSALESQLLALGAEVSVFSSVDTLIYHLQTREQKDAVILFHPRSKSAISDTRELVEYVNQTGRHHLILTGSKSDTDPLKALSLKFNIGYLNLPCRSKFLSESLQNLQAPLNHQQNSSAETESHPYLNRTFLVADDNEINRILLKSQLSQTGAVVLEANDGKETLELLYVVVFDLIFLDLQMPVMHGMEVIGHLRSNENINQETPVIAVTAHARPDQVRNVLDAGFSECLIKPILKPRLNTVLRKWLTDASSAARLEASTECEDCTITAESIANRTLRRTEGDVRLASILLQRFYTEMPDQLTQIDAEIHSGNYDEAKKTTHMLHGSLSFFDFDEIRSTASALESSLDNGEVRSVNEELNRLKDDIAYLVKIKEAVLEQIMQRNSA